MGVATQDFEKNGWSGIGKTEGPRWKFRGQTWPFVLQIVSVVAVAGRRILQRYFETDHTSYYRTSPGHRKRLDVAGRGHSIPTDYAPHPARLTGQTGADQINSLIPTIYS